MYPSTFYDPQHPIIERSELDLAALGYRRYIVDVKGDHSDLTAEYAAIPAEMKSVAAYFGKEYLRQLPAEIFYENLAEVRQHTSDRAVIRAHHFFTENLRAQEISRALKEKDVERFLKLFSLSGRSSFVFCRTSTPAFPLSQPASVALMAAEHLLGGRGACRIHGGGFGGTIRCLFLTIWHSSSAPRWKKLPVNTAATCSPSVPAAASSLCKISSNHLPKPLRRNQI